MPSRTSSTKLRSDSTRPPADCDSEVAIPVGVNCSAVRVSLRTTIAPTASPTPSHRRRFTSGGSFRGTYGWLCSAGGAGGLAAVLDRGADLAVLVRLPAGRGRLAQAVPERGHL